MPTYEYKREDGSTFEIRQDINDKPLAKCPETGQKVKRVISGGGGVIYKGDGFYITDYKNKEKKKSNGKAAEEETSAGSETTGAEQQGSD